MILALSTLALSLALPTPPQEGACCSLYPSSSGPLVIEIEAEEPLGLLQLAEQYAELTGHHLLANEAVRAQLSAASTGLFRSVTVPAREVQSFFEHICTLNGIAVIPVRRTAPRLMRLESTTQGSAGARIMKSQAVFLNEKDLPHLAEHPATLVTTTLNLPNTDVRQLSTTLRALLIDNNTQNISPAGQTNNLVITAFGPELARLARLLREIDTASARVAPVETAGFQVQILRLQYAHAYEVAKMLSRVFSPPAPPEGQPAPMGPRFVVDERMNAVVVNASPTDLERIKALVAELDQRADNDG